MTWSKAKPEPEKESLRVLGLFTATSIVVANMIGTGIFTTSGFLAGNLQSPFLLLFVWLVGGVVALCGALSYAELASAMPKSGGEYYFLSKIYHPAVGFLSGWISLVVGFSAPIAAAAVAFGKYLSAVFPDVPVTGAAITIVILFSILHSIDVRLGGYTQNMFTILKVVLIVLFLVIGFIAGASKGLTFPEFDWDFKGMFSPAFAVSLIFVSFAYSGWNAAAYIGGEVKDPRRNLPRALITGTLIVTFLYLGLNLLYIYAVPMDNMDGVLEIGHLTAVQLMGTNTGNMFSLLIALALVAAVSAMIMAGPRVYLAVGEDMPFFKMLSYRLGKGAPVIAIALQGLIAILMILTMSFDVLLYYIGFTLSIFTGLAVMGVYVVRIKNIQISGIYQTWGYPVTPALFILLSCWMVFHTLFERPMESLAGLGTIFTGLIIYFLTKKDKALPEK